MKEIILIITLLVLILYEVHQVKEAVRDVDRKVVRLIPK